MHEAAEVFDNDAEAVFRYIQVFTAICDSFAHGANDVSNAMGPFMTVYAVYHAGKVKKNYDSHDDSCVSPILTQLIHAPQSLAVEAFAGLICA